jgi:hypothetical protein
MGGGEVEEEEDTGDEAAEEEGESREGGVRGEMGMSSGVSSMGGGTLGIKMDKSDL